MKGRQIMSIEKKYFGKTQGKGYAETLLEEGEITKEDYETALLEEWFL